MVFFYISSQFFVLLTTKRITEKNLHAAKLDIKQMTSKQVVECRIRTRLVPAIAPLSLHNQ